MAAIQIEFGQPNHLIKGDGRKLSQMVLFRDVVQDLWDLCYVQFSYFKTAIIIQFSFLVLSLEEAAKHPLHSVEGYFPYFSLF